MLTRLTRCRTSSAKGQSLGQQWLEMAVMAGVAVVGLTIARLLFRITPEGR